MNQTLSILKMHSPPLKSNPIPQGEILTCPFSLPKVPEVLALSTGLGLQCIILEVVNPLIENPTSPPCASSPPHPC